MKLMRSGLLVMSVSAAAFAFAGGVFAGLWAVKNGVSERMRQHLAAVDEWLPINTHLVRIEKSVIRLPGVTGWGGGVKALDDGRILYSSGHGSFGVVRRNGTAFTLPFKVNMNFEGLQQHRIFQAKNFDSKWFRVTDINLSTTKPGRTELLVGHHYFNAESQCVELWLSRGVIDTSSDSILMVEPFRKVMATSPCITFSGPDDPTDAFHGWASGGRILRLPSGRILFSTGDHKWNGLQGYPALSQDDDSTLGKILIIDLETDHVGIHAKGFRNPQGLMMDSTGRVWETEHGPRGGDELNLIVAGGNYGWPECTLGTDYGPRPWPLNSREGRHDCGVPPIFSWNPSIAVSNLIESRGEEFTVWANDFIVLSLGGQAIHRLRLTDNRVLYDEQISFPGHRLRDISQFPDGRLVILTDEAELILIRNADRAGSSIFLDPRTKLQRSIDMPSDERARAVSGGYNQTDKFEKTTFVVKPSSRGEQIFRLRCAHCHSTGNGEVSVAPNLRGIIGRKIGSTRFSYSNALLNRDTWWSAENAVAFAVAPSTVFPGSIMPPVSLSIDERIDLVSYLASLK